MTVNSKLYFRLGSFLKRGLPAVLFSLLLQSCFTGIESTPKITYKDVRKEHIDSTAEERLAQQFTMPRFRDWHPGNLFLVTDDKASLSYTPLPGDTASVRRGDILAYCGIRSVPSIFGGNSAELLFLKMPLQRDTIVYRSGVEEQELRTRNSAASPFLVDMQGVAATALLLCGREFFTRTERWLDSAGREIRGRKFIKIRIDSVLPADENYPFRVCFTSVERPEEKGALLMSATVTDGTPALRGFADLFYISDPRRLYPQITDTNWELIRQSKLATGMTTQEASLSIGAPRDLERAHDRQTIYERWLYPGGVYLIFEDGILTRTNR